MAPLCSRVPRSASARPTSVRRTTPRPLAGLTLALAGALGASLVGCQDAPTSPTLDAISPEASALESRAGGVRIVQVPAEDPGPPFYTRVSPYPQLGNQVFTDGRTVAIPIYRDPACIPADFNLFQMYDPPSQAGPGAFSCRTIVEGHYLIEANAPFGQIPFMVHIRRGGQVWFVDHDEFMARTADGILPWGRLAGEFTSLRIGMPDHFSELLRPRMEPEQQVIISSWGRLDDGGRFRFNVNHRGSEVQSIVIGLDR